MAKGHKGNSEGKEQITRRSYLQLAGAAAATTALGGAVSTKAVAAQTDTVVDLGEKGLSNGDVIDGYLQEYVGDGVEVRIPEGEYDWKGDGFSGLKRNAAIIGQGEVILHNKAGSWSETIHSRSGTVEIRNITLRGITTGDYSRFRLEADSGTKILIDNFNFPDGSEEGAEARPFYLPSSHSGTVAIRNCYFKGFSNNGIYASSPGKGGDGPVIVENCVSHNNNIAGIRVGSSGSVVRNCLVLNDGPAPRNWKGQRNMRGIRVREKGKDIRIENCEVIHSYSGSGFPIAVHRGAEGGSGTIVDTKIRNDTSRNAMNFQDSTEDNWSTSNVSITGSGNLSYPSNFEDVTVGDDAEEPTGDDPQEVDGETWSDKARTLEIISTDSGEDLYYDLVVDGEVRRAWVSDKIKAGNNDEIVENDDGTVTVHGYTGNTYGDAYEFAGDVLSFEQTDGNSGCIFRLDGEEVTLEQLIGSSADDGSVDEPTQDGGETEEPVEDDGETEEPTQDDGETEEPVEDDGETEEPAEDLPNILILDGTISDQIAKYRVVVTGDIVRDEGLSSVVDGGSPWDEIEDRVGETSATGLVAKGIDGYRFSGQLVSLQIDGRVDVTLEQTER